MAVKIETDYKKLLDKSQQIYSILYEPGGFMSNAKALKDEMDKLSKAWKTDGHYAQLNAINKEYSTLIEYINLLEKYRKILYDAGTEYKKAAKNNTEIAKV